jgi:hypothetical protein
MLVTMTDVADVPMLVRVHMKNTNEQEHAEQPSEQPTGGDIQGPHHDMRKFMHAMWKQVQYGNAQHQAADKAHQELHLAMRKPHQPRESAAAQRSGDDQNAIQCQKQLSLHSPIVVKSDRG